MVIDNITIFGKTVDSVKNTMIDNIHIKGGQAPIVWDDDFHFAKDTNASGLGVVECVDGVDEPMQSLKISGNTGSSTNNLLDFTTPKISTNPAMTVTRNNNEFTFSGTLQTWKVYLDFQQLFLEDGKSYIVSCNKYWGYGSVGVRAQMEIRAKPNSGATSTVHQGWGGSIKFTVDNSKYTYWIRVQSGPTAGEFNETLRWWLNEGNTALEYEPFEPVTAAPTKLTVDSESINAFSNFSVSKNGVTMSYDGEFLTINGTCMSNADIMQRYVNAGARNEFPSGALRIVAEYVSGSTPHTIDLWYGFSTQTAIETLSQGSVALKNGVYTVITRTIKDYKCPMNLFFRPSTGATYDNFKVRFRFEKHTPQTVTIPTDYDMSRGNNILVDNIAHLVKYNNTDITLTDYEFAHKLLALKTYDGYTRVRVDSNVPVPIETNYWKQIKP